MTCCSFTPSPFWKWVYSKRQEFAHLIAPKGTIFISFRVNPLSEGRQNNIEIYLSRTNVRICKVASIELIFSSIELIL